MVSDPIISQFESKLNENINLISSIYQNIIDIDSNDTNNKESPISLVNIIQDMNDNLGLELSMITESHNDFSNINLLNIQSEKVSVYKNKDHKSCEIINQEMIKIQQRHVDSSLVSFEQSSKKCDEYLLEKIQIYLTTIETNINNLPIKLEEYHNHVNYTEESIMLINTSIKTKYDEMKNNYRLLMDKMLQESNIQRLSLISVQNSQLKWYMNNLNEIITNYQNNNELNNRKMLLFNNTDVAFQDICNKTYSKLELNNNLLYKETENYLDKIINMKIQVLEWKSQIVITCEEQINIAEVGLDSYYMSSLEEIYLELHNLLNSLYQLLVYQQKLDHLIHLAKCRETLIDQYHHKNNNINHNSIKISNTSSKSNDDNTDRDDNMYDNINQLTKLNIDDFQTCSHVLMGTRIKSLAQSCELPPESTKEILEYLLC